MTTLFIPNSLNPFPLAHILKQKMSQIAWYHVHISLLLLSELEYNVRNNTCGLLPVLL